MSGESAWYPCVVHAWDNTPRSGRNGLVLVDATPELFRGVLNTAIDILKGRPLDERLLFLKSWNEWAEGNHLEPDTQFGTKFLEAVADAVGATWEEYQPPCDSVGTKRTASAPSDRYQKSDGGP